MTSTALPRYVGARHGGDDDERGDFNVAAQLGSLLAYARRRGLPFATAWDEALACVTWPSAGHAENWVVALKQTRDEWESAYQREPSSAAHAKALQALIDAADWADHRGR